MLRTPTIDQQPSKKPYTSPRLSTHGDLRTLTQSGSLFPAGENTGNKVKNRP